MQGPHSPGGQQQRPSGQPQRGRGCGRGRGRGGRGRGRGQQVQPVFWYPQQSQAGYTAAGGGSSVPAGYAPHPGGVPTTGTIICNSVTSHLNINALHVGVTNSSSACLPSDMSILGSVPHPVVCQICFSAGHSAVTCPSRFTQPSAPVLLTTPGESNPAIWYPDSGVSAHMTASEGNTRSWTLASAV
ncbi:unnamed protein product [Cuscuta europaea]|uniref:Uncharacterized protein n=1 Tax=Cuscuta europaea TaxID=41803 RepID=A0A9P0ZCA6_CUSEU|nr:unnamed protein product [Cuscuta europaea]